MEKYSELELDNDIKYVKSVISKCSGSCKTLQEIVKKRNKIFSSRLGFIFFQFRNVYIENIDYDYYCGK